MTTPNEDISEQLTQRTEDLSITITDNLLTICANCGKEGNNPNTCNKCKAATYCNAACKKKHRHKHTDACEKRIAELHEEELERERREAELYDEKLFKQPPHNEDCPICMLLLPSLYTGRKYRSCCGKNICSGCIHAVAKRDGVGLCPFCRTPGPTSDEELLKQIQKRMEVGDADAIYNLGCCYSDGDCGLHQDYAKALELWHRSAKLGYATSYFSIAAAYDRGNVVERDEGKSVHYTELAAIGGHTQARHNLGYDEGNAGNWDRALKHFMISAGEDKESLCAIQEMFKKGAATKEDYIQALRAYQAYLGEIKSVQRDEAAAAFERYKYY